ncbi:MAG: thioesterase family protein [Venatoribacter sp.]
MNFTEYLTQAAQHNTLTIDAGWGQGRTTFGGLSAALLLHKIQPQLSDDDVLRSLSVNFCGPLMTETECELSTQELRSGKSVSHFQGQVTQEQKLVTQATACFSKNRESSIVVTPETKSLGEAGEGKRLPYIKGLTPEFTQHIDFAYNAGGFPFTNSKDNFLHGWMRFKELTGEFTNAHLVALIDAWPPTTTLKLKGPAPSATVTWSLQIVQPITELTEPLSADTWLWYEAEITQAGNGYGHTQAKIYAPNGVLLAISSQLVVAYS